MTCKEAADLLEIAAKIIEWDYSLTYQVAFEMAIEVLNGYEKLKEKCNREKKLIEEMVPYLQHTCRTCAWWTPAPSCNAPGGASECIQSNSWKWKGFEYDND